MFIAAMPALTHEIASVAFGGRGTSGLPVFCIVGTQTAGITEGQATLSASLSISSMQIA